jgi:hypothetical protein
MGSPARTSYSEQQEEWHMRGPRDIALVAVPLALFIAAVSAIGAFATSRACDVTRVVGYGLKNPDQYQSGYCRLGHFPGFPDTLTSGLFVAGAWGLPLVVVIVGGIAAVATNRPRLLWISTAPGCLLALVAWIVSASLAGVHYKFI